MADDKKYQITKEGRDAAEDSSLDFSGRGAAVYANDDNYVGDYVEGVRINFLESAFFFLVFISLF